MESWHTIGLVLASFRLKAIYRVVCFYCPISSIKEKVKKNTSTAAGDFLTFQPMYMSKDGSDLPPHGLGSLHSRVRLFGFSLPAVFIVWLRRSQSVLKPTSKTVVRCQPWFYLRLVAYSFFGLSERA